VCIALWTCAFAATHAPKGTLPSTGLSDPTLHFFGYLVLSGVLLLSAASYGLGRLKGAMAVICTTMIYAAFDEITQPLVNRQASIGDWLADVAGAAAGVGVLEIILLVLAQMALRRKAGQAGH
jgi:VanZ family protein